MKHSIRTTPEGVLIQADAAPEFLAALQQELAKCAAGTCSCPSPQNEKLSSIEVASGLIAKLTAKVG